MHSINVLPLYRGAKKSLPMTESSLQEDKEGKSCPLENGLEEENESQKGIIVKFIYWNKISYALYSCGQFQNIYFMTRYRYLS